MKTLVYETILAGHRLEYIHHVYIGACERPEGQYVFVIPPSYMKQDVSLEWPQKDNIKIVALNENEVLQATQGSNIKKKWHQYRLLRKYARREHPDVVLLIMMMSIVPFLFLPISAGVKIWGIIYRIYLYEQNFMSSKTSFFNRCVYRLFICQTKFEKLFILNDKTSTEKLNKIYKTNKFQYIPDPIPSIDKGKLVNIRSQIGANDHDIIYLHFGGLTKRKGTLCILESLQMMEKSTLSNRIFVFAGRLYPDIRNEFNRLVHELSCKVRIIVYEGFCSYSLLNNLCYSCDAILMPYSNTSQSSGVIGYAAYFRKPVIAPGYGLLGNLVSCYNLGITMNDVSPAEMAGALKNQLPSVKNNYSESHTMKEFINTLLS